MSGYNYTPYTEYVKTILEDEKIFYTFKQNPYYTDMLEHVSERSGMNYILAIWGFCHLKDEDIENYCKENDRIGSPIQYNYSPTLTCSPTSLRYVFQSSIILQYIQSLGLTEVHIVEVGGGYGGLFLALQSFAKNYGITLRKYSIIDLKEPSDLQKKYLSNHTLTTPVTFHDASNFGTDIEGEDLFFVSCYCFSEISDAFQQKYREHLLPKCTHGFIAWNMIDVYDIGKELTITNEVPEETGAKNKFVFF